MHEYCSTYSLLIDPAGLRAVRVACIQACLEAMIAEVRFDYTDIYLF